MMWRWVQFGSVKGLCAWGLILAALPVGAQSPGGTGGPDPALASRLQACTACHAPQDPQRADAFVPRLAGKPAAYLLAQMHHFREGRRHNPVMRNLLQGLPEDYLAQIARYFAAQTPRHNPVIAGDRADAGQMAAGEQLALRGQGAAALPACAACHGERLMGVLPAVPGLLGLPRNYLVGQLGAWRNGQRHANAPDCMARVARALSEQDLTAVAAWLAAQPVPADSRPASGAQRPSDWRCAVDPVGDGAGRP
jgi:cytochrome c553